MRRWLLIILIALAMGALAAGVVMAAPNASEHANNVAGLPPLDVTPTVPIITPTVSFTHPVGLAVSKYFSLTYTEVMSLHSSGLGFGEIARLYMIAEFTDKTPAELLAMRDAGLGWGEIMKQADFKPGGKNLGAIMSSHGDKSSPPGKPDNSDRSSCPGNSCNAPGHNKSKK